MFEVAGSASVVTLDVHNPSAYQNAFRCNTEHLDACRLFASHLGPLVQGAELAVVSPDTGGVKRAYRFRQCLEAELNTTVDTAFCEKYRKAGRLSGELLAGNVAGTTAILYDDMISSGQTMARAARVCLQHGALRVVAAASHALFAAGALDLLADAGIGRLVVTDSAGPVAPVHMSGLQLDVVSCAGLFAEAIKRMHEGGSVSGLATW
jgi:ribose-phosphate pyrophosphokinase